MCPKVHCTSQNLSLITTTWYNNNNFLYTQLTTVVFVWFVQVMSHAEAAQLASLVFLCVHRENYDFLEALAHQLSGKVPSQTPVNQAAMLEYQPRALLIIRKVLVDVSNNLKKNIYPEANAEYLQR